MFSYRKGIRRRYALGLISTKARIVLLPTGNASPVEVAVDSRSKYRSVCQLKYLPDRSRRRLSLEFKDLKDKHDLGLWSSRSETARTVGGFDQYPFASPFGPALFLLTHGTSLWHVGDVMRQLVAIAATTETIKGFIGLERLYIDACRLGIEDTLNSLVSLSTDRLRWLRAVASMANGDVDTTLELCAELPEGQYPERNTLVVAAGAMADHSSTEQHRKLLRAVDTSTAEGRLLTHIVSGRSISRAELRTGARMVATWIADPSERRAVLATFEDLKAESLRSYGSALERHDAFRVAYALLNNSDSVSDTLPPLSEDILGDLSLSTIDDIIDCGLVKDEDVTRMMSLRPSDAAYLALRLDPSLASEAQLRGPEASDERARRSLVAQIDSGRTPLDRRQPSCVRAMLELRAGRPLTTEETESLPRPWRAGARLLSEFWTSGDMAVADQLAHDPTVRSVIIDNETIGTPIDKRQGPLANARAKRHLWTALDHLFSADWRRALNAAREVLRVTDSEEIRDEALNLLACAQWQLGNDEQAIAALRLALEDDYNAALQVNIGVIAAALEPAIAAQHLGRLATEAPTAQLSFRAIMRGYNIWSVDPDTSSSSLLPDSLRGAARSLASQAASTGTLEDAEFWLILETLAIHDSDWLKTEITYEGVDLRSQMITVALARAESPIDYIGAVGRLRGSDSPWCAEQHRTVVDLVLGLQSSNPTSQLGAMMGMELLDTGIPMSSAEGVRLRLFTVMAICYYLQSEDKEPAYGVRERFVEANALLDSCTSTERLDLRGLHEIAGSALLSTIVRSRLKLLVEVADATDQITQRVRSIPRRRLDVSALMFHIREMKQVCRASIADVELVRPYTTDHELLKGVDNMLAFAADILRRLNSLAQRL